MHPTFVAGEEKTLQHCFGKTKREEAGSGEDNKKATVKLELKTPNYFQISLLSINTVSYKIHKIKASTKY